MPEGTGKRERQAKATDVTECEKCKGTLRGIACIEDSVVIEKILAHLKIEQDPLSNRLPQPRAPPELPGWDQGLIE